MLIEKFDAAADQASARALYEVYAAGAPTDSPGSPVMSARVWRGLMFRGWCDEPRENWLARRAPAEAEPIEAGRPEGRSWAGTHWSCPTGRIWTERR